MKECEKNLEKAGSSFDFPVIFPVNSIVSRLFPFALISRKPLKIKAFLVAVSPGFWVQ